MVGVNDTRAEIFGYYQISGIPDWAGAYFLHCLLKLELVNKSERKTFKCLGQVISKQELTSTVEALFCIQVKG